MSDSVTRGLWSLLQPHAVTLFITSTLALPPLANCLFISRTSESIGGLANVKLRLQDMPKARRNTRKAPVTQSALSVRPAPSGSSSNPAATRTLIRKFHVLIKQKAQLEKSIHDRTASAPKDARSALAEVEREIEALGGLQAYQRMSSIGQGNDRGGGSEKVLISWLKEQGFGNPSSIEKRRLR